MKVKFVWLLLSCLMVAALLLTSCAPAAPAEEKPSPPVTEKPAPPEEKKPAPPEEEKVVAEKVEMVKIRATKVDGTVVEKMVEKPRYGGEFIWCQSASPLIFDQSFGHLWNCLTTCLTNDGIMQGDWSKGPAGTGEASWIYGSSLEPRPLLTGSVAESWEFPDSNSLIYHIRKGIHFHNKPPVNGRELDAYDVVETTKHVWSNPKSHFYTAYEYETLEALDKWTVKITLLPGRLFSFYRANTGYMMIYPREMIGDGRNLTEWRDSIGTGPFVLTDFVSDSSVTFKRNPDYWMKDPLHPENQLPYVDNLKWLVITDASTRLAALRTSKIDQLMTITWEDAEQVIATNPELKRISYPSGGPPALFIRHDTAPFSDLRVRRAMAMAVDNEAIARDYYKGQATVLAWPWLPIPEYSDLYVPLEEQPEHIRELYEYHPDKAKQLLAEAGYPDGFKTSIVCYKDVVDILSIVKAYWEKVGVELELDVKDYAVWYGMILGHKHKEIAYWAPNALTASMYSYLDPKMTTNVSRTNDPYLNEMQPKIEAGFPDEAAQHELFREITPHVLEIVVVIQLPAPYYYTFWQPWVKGYQGEYEVGYGNNFASFQKYLWIDRDLKEEMIGKR